MGLGRGIAAAIRALAQGAHDVKAYKALGPEFRSILAAREAARGQAVRKGEVDIEGAQLQNADRQQQLIRDAIANAANIEPEEAIVGMGEVGMAPRPEVEDRTEYPAPPAGTGLSPDTFGAMARGARTERRSALESLKAEARRQLSDESFQQKRALLGDKHTFTMEELAAKGLTAREIERLRQEGRVQIVGMQQAGADRRNEASIAGRAANVETMAGGMDANRRSRDMAGVIASLQRGLRTESDPNSQNVIKARVSALEAERERSARGMGPRRAPAAQPTPSPAPSAAPPAPARAQQPVPVKSRQEAEALPDGALFIFGGRTFRKVGPGRLEVVQ